MKLNLFFFMDKICDTCLAWQPNGGILRFGYCMIKEAVYRRFDQFCSDWVQDFPENRKIKEALLNPFPKGKQLSIFDFL